MSEDKNCLLKELKKRQLIAQSTADEELHQHLNQQSQVVYCGFDPTADSLHLGHLVPLLVLKRFQMAGHKPIALVGGATGLIGDPSFKAAERQLQTEDIVATWVEKIKKQVERFIDFECGECSAVVANNLDWTSQLSAIDFLRNVGKYFSVNAMIQKESVQQRLNREGAGISFTEFSYALLQGLDFAELNRRYDCTIQLGGSDQWGNIVGGIDLTRRLNKEKAFGLTVPLITKSDGSKFGKTEKGAIWLDPKKTSPYMFYQFWLNSSDADVYNFLNFFTFLSVDEIQNIQKEDEKSNQSPKAQSILASEVTELVHGKEGLSAAKRITEALFVGDVLDLSESDLEQLKQDGLPSKSVSLSELSDQSMVQFLTDARLVKSGKQVKDALNRSAVFFNGEQKTMQDNMNLINSFTKNKALYNRFYIVQLGKKNHFLFEVF